MYVKRYGTLQLEFGIDTHSSEPVAQLISDPLTGLNAHLCVRPPDGLHGTDSVSGPALA